MAQATDNMNSAQRKRAKNKAERDAEKAKRKAENVAKVEATKAAKAKKPKTEVRKAKTQTGPVVRRVKDVWHELDLEKKGVEVTLDENGNKIFIEGGTVVEGEGKKVRVRKVATKNRRSHRNGRHRNRPVCVEKKDGEKVRVTREKAAELVAAGGRYIPKHDFKDEWKDKKGNNWNDHGLEIIDRG